MPTRDKHLKDEQIPAVAFWIQESFEFMYSRLPITRPLLDDGRETGAAAASLIEELFQYCLVIGKIGIRSITLIVEHEHLEAR